MKKMGCLTSCFAQKAILISVSCLITVTSFVCTLVHAMSSEVQIQDDGLIFNTKIYSNTVKDALSETGIDLREYDEISCNLESRVKDIPVISIKRAKAVIVNVDGSATRVYTTADTVGEVIDELAITEDNSKYVITDRNTEVTENLIISVVTASFEEAYERSEIPFDTVKRENNRLLNGTTKVVTKGENGIKKYTYRVIKNGDTELSRQLVSESIEKEPVTQIVEYGTYVPAKVEAPAEKKSTGGVTSRDGGMRYSRVIDVSATAYDISFESTGKRPGDRGYGITATGMQAKRGVIAVDPSVIPLGSRVYIESLDGYPDYGYAVAGDTGGAIKGNKIDLCMDTRNECLQFGRRRVRVYILD